MSGQAIDTNAQPKLKALLSVRWSALALLLAAEVIALSFRFDSGTLLHNSHWMSQLVKHSHTIPQILAVILTATLIFGGRDLSAGWQGLGMQAHTHRWPLWLSLHLAVFGLYFVTTRYVFEVDRGASPAWLLLWMGLSAACALTWGASAIDPGKWHQLSRGLIQPLMMGLLVGLAGWGAGQLAMSYWRPFAHGTFQLVSVILGLTGVELAYHLDRLTIGTPTFAVSIAPACSGYEGMGLAAVFMSTYLWWCRKDHLFPRAFMLVPLAVAIMFLANAIRIAALILVGHFGWQSFALGGFHSQAGWLAFNVVVIGLVAYARVSPFFSHTCGASTGRRESTAAPMLIPFVVLTLSIMATDALAPGSPWLYPVRVIAVLVAVLALSRWYRPGIWDWPVDWVAPLIGIACYLIWIALEPRSTSDSQLASQLRQSESWLVVLGWYGFRIVGSVITVPIAEEFAFRGYLLPWLSPTAGNSKQDEFSWMALLLSSAAFGLLHPGRWIAGTIAGALFGMALWRRKCLMDAVVAHATTNGLLAVHVILTSQWSLWE